MACFRASRPPREEPKVAGVKKALDPPAQTTVEVLKTSSAVPLTESVALNGHGKAGCKEPHQQEPQQTIAATPSVKQAASVAAQCPVAHGRQVNRCPFGHGSVGGNPFPGYVHGEGDATSVTVAIATHGSVPGCRGTSTVRGCLYCVPDSVCALHPLQARTQPSARTDASQTLLSASTGSR